jgi:hypothetical protein
MTSPPCVRRVEEPPDSKADPTAARPGSSLHVARFPSDAQGVVNPLRRRLASALIEASWRREALWRA